MRCWLSVLSWHQEKFVRDVCALSQVAASRQEQYFDVLEKKEQMETKMSSTTEMKCRVVSCKQVSHHHIKLCRFIANIHGNELVIQISYEISVSKLSCDLDILTKALLQ